MASIAASQAHPSHYLYQSVDQASTELATNTETLELFPMREGQNISQFLAEVDWDKLKNTYSDLLDSYVSWINENWASTDESTINFTNFKAKILDAPKINSKKFNADVFGKIHAELTHVRQLLDDESIPLDTRKSICNDIAFRMAKCTEGFKTDLQVSLMLLLAAKEGCQGDIQRKRLEAAKQIARQTIEHRAYNSAWEIHAVNYLVSSVAIQYGLPSFQIDDYIQNQTVRSIASRTVVNVFRETLELRLSPCGIYRAIVDNCLEHYQNAILASGISIGQCFTIQQLPTGQITDQITVCTASIGEYIKDFSFQFPLILEEVSHDAEVSPETEQLYRITLQKLKFELMNHIINNLVTRIDSYSPCLETWDLSHRVLSNNTVDHCRLCFEDELYFYIEDEGSKRAVTLQDLSTFEFHDFSLSSKYALMSEAIINCYDCQVLNDYYINTINKLKNSTLKAELTDVLVAHLQDPEASIAVDKWITQLAKSADSFDIKTTPLVDLTIFDEKPLVQFLSTLSAYTQSKDDKLGWSLIKNFHEQLSCSLLKSLFTLSSLKSYILSACAADNDKALKLLMTVASVNGSYSKTLITTHFLPMNVFYRAIHLCIIHKATGCLGMLLTQHKDQINLIAGIDTGLTPLHLAIIFNNDIGVQQLLSADADINAQSKNGYTAMHWAIYYRRTDLVKCLLNNSPNLYLQDAKGQNCYMTAKKSTITEIANVVSHATVEPKDMGIDEEDMDIDAKPQGVEFEDMIMPSLITNNTSD
ncbi:MAG: hypothetical protein HAW66_07385 [Shewanella sp.]|nr:hypothetical protein [Shewanella sp.]